MFAYAFAIPKLKNFFEHVHKSVCYTSTAEVPLFQESYISLGYCASYVGRFILSTTNKPLFQAVTGSLVKVLPSSPSLWRWVLVVAIAVRVLFLSVSPSVGRVGRQLLSFFTLAISYQLMVSRKHINHDIDLDYTRMVKLNQERKFICCGSGRSISITYPT